MIDRVAPVSRRGQPLVLEPPSRADNAHAINKMAYEFWTSDDPDVRQERYAVLDRLCIRRKKTGTRDEPVRRTQGKYATADLEERQRHLRVEAYEAMSRLLGWAAWHADWRSNKVGAWCDGKMHYMGRINIAERAGFPARIDRPDDDSGRRIRAYKLDRRNEDLIAAGLFFRHEEERYLPLVFKVTRLLWIVSGVQKERERYGKLEKDKADQAERDWEEAYQRDKAARRGQQRTPEVAVFVDGMARERTNDTDFTDEGRGWPPRKKPPPS